jgi:hypothetical protein
MREVLSVVLALLAGVLFPVLIWVALFVAIREPLLQAARRVASVVLALLAGVLFPVLIWVGLVVAINHLVRGRIRQVGLAPAIDDILAAAGLTIQRGPLEGSPVAVPVFAKQPMSEIHGLLARAGLEGGEV